MAIPLGSAQREQAKTQGYQCLPGKGLTACISSCGPRVRCLISLHLEVAWAPPSSSPLSFTPMIKACIQFLPERSLPTLLAPQLLWLPLEGLASKWHTSESHKGSALASSPSPQNTKWRFLRCVITFHCYPPPHSHSSLSTDGPGKNTRLPVSPWKGFDDVLFQLLPNGGASN